MPSATLAGKRKLSHGIGEGAGLLASVVAVLQQIPRIVATNLTCEDKGGDLKESDIEVGFRTFGRWDIAPPRLCAHHHR